MVCASLLVPPVSLGEDKADVMQETIEEVTVIGTRIQRQDYVSPSPVFTIDRASLVRDGTRSRR